MSDCPERIPPFEGSPGLIIAGHIQPPLEGVAMVIELEDSESIHTTTDNKGQYRWVCMSVEDYIIVQNDCCT